tara:strand:- start:1392 stop:1592 length:201 start_codon:yes stop_codon:yes gene_type:complete
MSAESDFDPINNAARAASPVAASAPRSASSPAAEGGWLFTFFDEDWSVLVRVLVSEDGDDAEVVEP